jgi:tetratricopeptide (TPR) repeat protein
LLLILILFLALLSPGQVVAQRGGGYAIWGEIKIDDSKADKPITDVTIILYKAGGGEVGRQPVSNRGRYRFIDLSSGEYEIVAEIQNNEIARVRLNILPGSLSPFYDFRQDFEFEWRPNAASKSTAGVISAADAYDRSAHNQSLFKKAQDAAEKHNYPQAITLLRQILAADQLDFQVWTLLGTVYLVQDNPAEAESAYLSAIKARPSFALALLDLGRLRASQKRFAEAIEPLTRAVESQPQSAEANLLLGEAYLQVRKGSKAIPYLEAAGRLGRAEAHLRLGWLYNAAGLKAEAAAEYEEFLKKRPGYAERKKLEEYIKANKKE